MQKERFNKLSVINQLKYVNERLLQGDSLRDISKDLNISKTTIRNRFQKIDYVFSKGEKQYIKNRVVNEDNTNILQREHENKEIKHSEYKYSTSVLTDRESEEKLKNLINNYNNIEEMIKWFIKEKNKKNNEIKIDTNKLEGEVKVTTVRLYDRVWSDFRKLIKENPEYKSMDLVSMALIEYMDKYKK